MSLAEQFHDSFGREPTLRLGGAPASDDGSHAPRAEALVYLSGEARWAKDPSGRYTVVLHGELWGTADPSAEPLAKRFADRGLATAADLNGSYALLVHDAHSGQIWAATDRRNSRWLFHGKIDGAHVVTTELAAQPSRDRPIDPVAVAWTLADGVAVRGRTPFDGIRVLDAASTHRLDQDDARKETYWAFSLSDRNRHRTRAQLQDDLYALVVQATRRCFDDARRVVVSMSVGWDLTAVLGVLTQVMHKQDLESFSYANGGPPPGSDAQLAVDLAGRLGLHHQTLDSYDGDLVNHIAANAWFGGGMANVCDELDALRSLGEGLAGDSEAVICTGDQRFGGSAKEFADAHEVLDASGLRRLELPDAVLQHTPESTVRRMTDGIEADREWLIAAQGVVSNLNDLQDCLRWNERLPNRIMPWRDRFIGRFARVRNPLLDNDLMHYVAGLPTSMRKGKELFKATASERFSTLYATPRARVSGYGIDLTAEIRRHSDRLRETILAGESRLDDVIPLDAVTELFLLAGGEPRGAKELGDLGKRQADRAFRKLRRSVGLKTTAESRTRLAVLFRRVAVLREALRA